MWAALDSTGASKILRFEREFAKPIGKLWAALTTPARIGDWLCADAEIDLRVGGRFHLAFRNGPHSMTGEITRLEPPHVLEYTWPESAAQGNSLILWELRETASGCRLNLTHTLLAGGDASDFASGWHWHLDALGGAADGAATVWRDDEWRALRDAYRARFLSLA